MCVRARARACVCVCMYVCVCVCVCITRLNVCHGKAIPRKRRTEKNRSMHELFSRPWKYAIFLNSYLPIRLVGLASGKMWGIWLCVCDMINEDHRNAHAFLFAAAWWIADCQFRTVAR